MKVNIEKQDMAEWLGSWHGMVSDLVEPGTPIEIQVVRCPNGCCIEHVRIQVRDCLYVMGKVFDDPALYMLGLVSILSQIAGAAVEGEYASELCPQRLTQAVKEIHRALEEHYE